MKRSVLLLCSAVWLVSLAAAYFIGSLKTPEPPPASTIPAKHAVVAVQNGLVTPDVLALSTEEESASALQALLVGEDTVLAEALREIPGLSAQEARISLGNALAMPKSDPKRARLIRELLSQIAETEPLAALELATQIESLRDNERARISILQVWGKNDPAAALAWASQALMNDPSRTRRSQLSAIYRGYAQSNPEAAFQEALAISDDDRLRNRILDDVIATQIENGGLQAAKLAIDLVADTQTQNNLRRELIDQWAQYDPEAAADYVRSLGEDIPTNYKTVLISEWAESDPPAAAEWLSQLPEDDPAIARASADIIQEWTRYDLTSSAEWLNRLPPSPDLDRAVANYTFRAAEEDPETAMTWAESIEDDRRRTWMMERVAASWKEQDADSFKSYLDNSELNEEQRKLLEEAQLRGGWRGRGRD